MAPCREQVMNGPSIVASDIGAPLCGQRRGNNRSLSPNATHKGSEELWFGDVITWRFPH